MGRPRQLSTARRARTIVAAAVLVGATACTSAVSGHGSRAPGSGASGASGTASGSAGSGSGPAGSSAPSDTGLPTSPAPSAGASTAACTAPRAQPDPNRPVADLTFTLSKDHTTVTGAEKIAFRPDRSITELVFRLTANTRPTVAEGNRIVVTSASADHGAGRATYSAANADPSTQGGLLHLPFASPIPAGTTVHARLAFTLTLGRQSFDRFGRTASYAWFASAQPLLAWQRGFGWHTEDMIDFPAESATSEAMDTTLTVTAPAGDTVVMSGDPADPPRGTGTRTWRARISAARDVSVAAGPFSISDTVVDGVHLRLGAPTAQLRDELVPEFHRAITELSKRFGPFPFPSLSVARLPASGGGIEYPSSILMLDGSRLVAVHETAHQWFYAMVGDSQALHPWMDEAFAEYAEQLVNLDAPPGDSALNAPGAVDASTESYGANENGYYFTTYYKGAAALEAARTAAGAAKWDRALRCYVAANAWRIVVPADLATALKGLPRAVAVLRQAGALK